MTQDAIMKKLRTTFDLNIYEAKIWAALLTKGVASASELADISGVPRSRSYDVLETLEKSAPSRIINVSSESHKGAHLKLDDLQGTKKYSGFRAYGETKLADIYFTYELARRLQGKGVTVNTLHPGFVKTHIGRNNRGGILFTIAATLFGISPAAGARTSIYLATSPEVEGVTGQYFIKCKPVPSSAVSYDKNIASKLWEASEKLTGLSSK